MKNEIVINNINKRKKGLKIIIYTSLPFLFFLVLSYPIFILLRFEIGILESFFVIISALLITGAIITGSFDAYSKIPMDFKITKNELIVNFKNEKKIDSKIDFKKLKLDDIKEVILIITEGKIIGNVAIEFKLKKGTSKWIRLTDKQIGLQLLKILKSKGITIKNTISSDWIKNHN